ncbi:MAG: fimbrillin family protein [Alistipes senegalensis]|nr:fimbrillin family protein [Bacteroides cellulosilyticus]MCM1351384.1 fimbrillin family protein [Alistipes senegalensis]
MKYRFVFLVVWVLSGCADGPESVPGFSEIRIVPRVESRAADGTFERDDAIGLTVADDAGIRCDNLSLTFDGNVFRSADGLRYDDVQTRSTLTAYYPYQPGGVPFRFTISTDQRGGCGPSDLLGALLPNVLPTLDPIEMIFHHIFARLNIRIDNRSGRSVTAVTIGGFVPTANIDFRTFSAAPVPGYGAEDVAAYCATPDAEYQAVLVPQTADLSVGIATDDGIVRTRTLPAVPMTYGEVYDLRVSLTSDLGFDLVLDGNIVGWDVGNEIGDAGNGDGLPEEPDPSTLLIYDGEAYRIEQVGNRTWMAENLRYIPSGARERKDYWYVNNNKNTVSELGLLYKYETAVAGDFPAPNSSAPVQGICPDGWRIPTVDEIKTLVDAVPREFLTWTGFHYVQLQQYGSNRTYLITSTVPASGKTEYMWWMSTNTTTRYTVLDNDVVAGSLRCVKAD